MPRLQLFSFLRRFIAIHNAVELKLRRDSGRFLSLIWSFVFSAWSPINRSSNFDHQIPYETPIETSLVSIDLDFWSKPLRNLIPIDLQDPLNLPIDHSDWSRPRRISIDLAKLFNSLFELWLSVDHVNFLWFALVFWSARVSTRVSWSARVSCYDSRGFNSS